MGSEEKLIELIRALTLENALSHKGRAVQGPVLGKLLSLRPPLKGRVKELVPLIQEIVDEVNSLPIDEQRNLLQDYLDILPPAIEKEERRGLSPLPEAEVGAVVTRFSPNPNFVLHLGSARASILSHDYAKMYKGRFLLRFEDTDPRTKRPVIDYYEAIREDLRWIGCPWDGEYIQSLRLYIYYRTAEELIQRGAAYICECDKDRFLSCILEGKPCPDRDLDVTGHSARFEKMLDGGYGQGEATLRVKTDLRHPNPAVRDWPGLRVIDTKRYPHPLTGSKYRVWPLYNYSCAIDDHFMGVTHIIRGVEHQVNEVRQRFIFQYMGWPHPRSIHYGRLSMSTGILSKSKILRGIADGLYTGYGDPRLATLISLRRRGFQPEAIRRVIHEVGINPSPAVINWSNLEAFNKKIIDPRANRRFVVVEPYELAVEWITEAIHAEIRLHPDFLERGSRRFDLSPEDGRFTFYIERSDAETYSEGVLVRLMGLANLEIKSLGKSSGVVVFKGYDVSSALEKKAPIIHWIPAHQYADVDLLWSDASKKKCLGEKGLLEEEPENIVQMERVGYARVASVKEGDVSLVFTHK